MSNIPLFPEQDSIVLIDGPAGVLETMVSHPKERSSESIAIICHPNPTQEGTMHNKVVTTLHKVFHLKGLRTVRFNYRGVGKSDGKYGEGVGEVDDLLSIVEWVKSHHVDAPIVLAGFSFGGYIALQVASQVNPLALVSVAPAVGRYDYCKAVGPISCPWVIAQGEADDIVPKSAVLEWLDTRNESPAILLFPETGHFFHGKLVDLRERLLENLPAV